jgi:Heterokaryon incompatibility protein (HET)
MDALYVYAKSFKTSSWQDRRLVDWSLGLVLALVKGVSTNYILGSDGFVIAQSVYLYMSGSDLFTPIFRIFKEGTLGDGADELTLAWLKLGVFVTSFHAVWTWNFVWTTIRELPTYQFAALSLILCLGIYWVFFEPSVTLDGVYGKYRRLDYLISYPRRALLRQCWRLIRPIAQRCKEPVGKVLVRLGRWMRLLPRDVAEEIERPYVYEKMVTTTEIRLLRLVPSPFSRTVRCRIEHHPLGRAPEYEAISYHWGDCSKTQQILIDGHWFKVTQNAHDALHNRSFYTMTRYVWIDSICIDQDDAIEKAKQVRLMTKIYNQATRVIVFLGDRPDAHMVHEVLAELNRRRKWYDESVLGENLYKEYLLQESSPRWQAFLNLLDQPWFCRIWVLQEVAVAKTVYAIYGNRYIDWESFVEVLRIFISDKSSDSMSLLFSAGDNYSTRQVSNAPGFASIMTTTRQLLQQGKSLPLSTLLHATHGFKATDPRDKLFALMGISDSRSCGSIRIDYTKDVSSLYRDTAHYMLIKEQNLSLLRTAGVGSARNLKDLPSWVPDWSCSSFAGSPGGTYMATKEKWPSVREVTIRGTRDCNAIAITGKVLDKVRYLSTERVLTLNTNAVYEGNLVTERQYSWYVEMKELVEQHVPEMYATRQPKEEALWRTLIGDQGADGVRPASSEYGEYYRIWHRILADIENFIACCKRNVLPPGFNTDQEVMEMIVRYTRFNSGFGQFNLGKRFCVTGNKYIGIVPPGTQPGDVICILFGADAPFVIREIPRAGSMWKSYSLVGDCYIHGIMDGEQLESQTPEEPIILR